MTDRKLDDDRPELTGTLDTDLTDASSVRLVLEHKDSGTLLVNAEAAIDDQSAGEVSYEFDDGDLNKDGYCEYEWHVIYTDGDDSWFPKDHKGGDPFTIHDGVARTANVDTPAAPRAGPLDVLEFNELGSDPDAPAADDWALFFKSDGNLYKIDENGSVSQVGGGSASIAIEDDGTEILGSVSTIDFGGSGFDVSEPTSGEAQVVLTSDSLTVTAGNALTGGGSVSLGGSTSLAVDESAIALANLAGDTDDLSEGGSNLFFTDARAQSAINADADHGSTASHNYYTAEDARDDVAAALVGGTNASISVDDPGDTITIDATDTTLTTEEVEDIVGSLITGGTDISTTYDDGAGTFTIDFTGSTGSGSAIVLDLGDDGTNESSDLAEIATVNDTNSIATEPTADKLLLDMSANWPTADDVPDSAVDHDQTTNYAASEHVDHSAVSVIAGTLLSGGGDLTADRTLNVDEGSIRHDGIDQSTVSEEDHHPRGGFDAPTTVTSQTHTLSPWESSWVDTAAAGGNVTETLPPDGDLADGDRVEVGVEDGTNNTDLALNTGQSWVGGPPPTLKNAGEVVSLEYRGSDSSWRWSIA